MKSKIQNQLILLIGLFVIMSCSCKKEPNAPVSSSDRCIDTTKINPDSCCFSIYKPVCGCNSVTYSNACEAKNQGVLYWTDGACDTADVSDTFYIQDFPNKVGDTWVYSFYDSMTNYSDTTTITIVGQTTLDNGRPATIWQFSPGGQIFLYVNITNDTVTFYWNKSATYLDIQKFYVFPLYVGKGWGNITDTASVVAKNSISVPAGRFMNAFNIQRIEPGTNPHGSGNTWLVPKVGIVWDHRYFFDQGPQVINKWELLSYCVK